MSDDGVINIGYDWVKAYAKCSPASVYRVLATRVSADVDAFNGRVEDAKKFHFHPGPNFERIFYIKRDAVADDPETYASFELVTKVPAHIRARVEVRGETRSEHKAAVVPQFGDEGPLLTGPAVYATVDEFSQQVLGDLFFPQFADPYKLFRP